MSNEQQVCQNFKFISINSNLIKHKFITPSGDTVEDDCLKTATRISVTIYHTAGHMQTHEIFANGDSQYNVVQMYVNNVWFQDVFSINKATGTITRTGSSGLNWTRVSIDYI